MSKKCIKLWSSVTCLAPIVLSNLKVCPDAVYGEEGVVADAVLRTEAHHLHQQWGQQQQQDTSPHPPSSHLHFLTETTDQAAFLWWLLFRWVYLYQFCISSIYGFFFFLSRLSGYYWLKNASLLYVFEQFSPNPALVVIVLLIGNSRYCVCYPSWFRFLCFWFCEMWNDFSSWV